MSLPKKFSILALNLLKSRLETGAKPITKLFEESVLCKGSSGLECHKTSRTFMGPKTEFDAFTHSHIEGKNIAKSLLHFKQWKVYDGCQEMPKNLCYFFMMKRKYLLINWTSNLCVNLQMQNVFILNKLDIFVHRKLSQQKS
jgi:hypothetical protein